MRFSVTFLRSRYLTRVAGASLLAGLAAGCSADTGRFASNPFSNPFGDRHQAASNDVADGYPAAPVRTQTLAPVRRAPRAIAAQPLPPVGSVHTVPSVRSPRYDLAQGARPVGATGSLPASPRIAAGRGSWHAEGGTAVTASAGDTVLTLSNRYGVPATAIMSANGLTQSTLQPGQRVIIPVYSTAEAEAPPVADPPPVLATARPVRTSAERATEHSEARLEPKPMTRSEAVKDAPKIESKPERRPTAEQTDSIPAVAAQAGGTHVVKPGETLTAIALAYGTTRPKIAKLNGIDEWTSVRIGQKLKVPGTAMAAHEEHTPAAEKPARPVKLKTAELKSVERTEPAKPASIAAAEAPATVSAKPAKGKMPVMAAPSDDEDDTASAEPVKPQPQKLATKSTPEPSPAEAPAAPKAVADSGPLAQPAERNAPEFRWPVKGRVIQAFGSGSDGINIAVPEGTEVRAAENGVVAYAGSELKGYGNLVLIKHADGYVTAYAHAKDLNVKRGDAVRRGQVIATAGQTGNVTAPQLLFELRKGATPIDPRRYLSGT